jgi:uncharacterized membrane protein
MASQKPAGRGSGSAKQGSGTGNRQGSGNRQNSANRQGSASRQNSRDGRTGTPAGSGNPARNGAAGGTAAGTGNGPARQARAGKAGQTRNGASAKSTGSTALRRGTGTGLAAGDAGVGPVGRLLHRAWSPFRSMGGLQLATWILSLYGLGASIYLTIAHYDTHVILACSDKGLVNCQEVTTSPESIVFGIFPVAVLGLAFYVFMVAVNSPWGWRLQQPAVKWARIGSVLLGMCFVLYLIYAELIEIRAICLWCTSVHIATFLIFALIVFHTTFSWGRPETAGRGSGR